MTLPSVSPSTTLRPPWVHLARAAWILLALGSFFTFVIGTVGIFSAPLPSCAGPGTDCSTNVQLTSEDAQIAGALGFPLPLLPFFMFFSLGARLSLALVAVVIFWRRSDEWVALIMSGALMSVLLEGVQGVSPASNLAQSVLSAIGTALFLPIPFIFPTGRVEPRWLLWPMVVVTALYTGMVGLFLNSPFYWTFTGVLTLFWIIFGGYSMMYRYRRVSNAVERQQTKWVLLGLGATFVVGLYYTTINSLYPAAQPSEGRVIALLINMPLYLGGYGFLAFSILVAMLRHRLWDIDLIIRRTLQYALLTGLLALAYFGGVIVLQGVLSPLTGSANSPLVTVVTTLGIAVLFSPLRRRVQDFIDRRFYRQKYDAEQALTKFAAMARDEVDMDRLAGALLGVVEETMQPDRATLLIRQEGS